MLEEVVKEYGAEKVVNALKVYLATLDNVQFASLKRFANTIGQYVGQSSVAHNVPVSRSM